MGLRRRSQVRVTDHLGWDAEPMWSEDGAHVVYSSRRGGRWRIYRRHATAVGPEELLLDASDPVTPLEVRSTHIIYASRRAGLPFDVWKLEGGRATPLARLGGFNPSDARLSPNEQWVAYGVPETSGNTWNQTLYVSGPPFGENRRVIAEAGSMPMWRADGRELFYLSKDSSVVAVPLDPRRTPSDALGGLLFRAPILEPTGVSGRVYDVAPDGERFLVKRQVGESTIHVILNWDTQLQR